MYWFTLEAVIAVCLVVVGVLALSTRARSLVGQPRARAVRVIFSGLFVGLCLAWAFQKLMEINIAALYMQWYFRFTYGN